MTIQLAQRISHIKPSATIAVSTKAAELAAQGKKIINLSLGEPDFDTPINIKNKAIEAINNGFTKYTAVAGTPGLKKAIVAKFARANKLEYSTKQILVSAGGKQSFYNLVQAIVNEGDEVIVPAPYWVSYPEIVLLAGGTPVIIETTEQQHFKLSPQQLEAAITPKTRLFIINSPSNPSGMAYTALELLELAKVLLKHPHVAIVSDDMYEHILWNQVGFINILNVCPELAPRTIIVNGVSKAYAMTGWRIGYAAGPENVITAMTTVQSQCTSGANSIAQVAAEEALMGDQTCIKIMLRAFKERHDVAIERLNVMEGVECLPTDGTFYLLPSFKNVIAHLPGVKDDVDLCEYLLTEAGVALVPGTAFGIPGHVRLSIALSMDLLVEALEAVEIALTRKER